MTRRHGMMDARFTGRRKKSATYKPLPRCLCQFCGMEFAGLTARARYCSDQCRWYARSEAQSAAYRAKKTTKSVEIKDAPEGGEDQKENFPIC